MANVIPPEEINVVRRKISARFILVASGAIAIGALIAILALMPAYLSVRVARASIDSAINQAAAGNLSAEQTAAVRTQGLITTLKPLASATSSPSDALLRALALKPPGVSITSITYSGGKSSVVLSGTSARREAVDEFRRALEASARFTTVSVPVSAIVGTQEGRFSITLGGI
jgi:Tfp pilus assembly protein PilN